MNTFRLVEFHFIGVLTHMLYIDMLTIYVNYSIVWVLWSVSVDAGLPSTSRMTKMLCIATCCFSPLSTGPVPFANRHIRPRTTQHSPRLAMALRPESVQDWCALAEGLQTSLSKLPLDDILIYIIVTWSEFANTRDIKRLNSPYISYVNLMLFWLLMFIFLIFFNHLKAMGQEYVFLCTVPSQASSCPTCWRTAVRSFFAPLRPYRPVMP